MINNLRKQVELVVNHQSFDQNGVTFVDIVKASEAFLDDVELFLK